MSAPDKSLMQRLREIYEKHPILSSIVLMLLAGVILSWLCLIFLNIWTHHGATATVPDIKNMTYAQAERVLDDSDLGIEISDSIYDTAIAPGTVIETWPRAGSVVKKGRAVYVTIVAFAPKNVTITMPIAGVSSRQAISYLNGIGVSNLRFVSVPSQYPDLVERATVGGKPIGVGSVIPVDATVVLEVGTIPEDAPVDEFEDTDSDTEVSAEEAIEQELTGQSTYIEEDE